MTEKPSIETQRHPQAVAGGLPPKPVKKKGGAMRFAFRHPAFSAFVVLLLLLGAFIGQNLEPTSVDFLFWSILDAPKVVLLLVGIPFGAVGWELLRRVFR